MKRVTVGTITELNQLREDPFGAYQLTADIDLGGQLWQPLDFYGSLDGNGKKIANLRICSATDDGKQGFFGVLGETATVSDLSLTGITVTAAADARYVGALAGENRGTVTNCILGADAPYVPTPRGNRNALTGLWDESCVTTHASACAGALAGRNTGTIRQVKSYLLLQMPQQTLCGENTGDVQGLCRDVSQRAELLPREAQAMRREVVAHMQLQGNFRWIPVKDMGFTSAYSGSYKIYEKDAVHYGLPYTQKYGSVERAQYCMTEDDHVASWLPHFSDAAPEAQGSTETPWDVYLGNDCSGAVYWAWQRVCPCVEFGYTGDMIPTEENQKQYGVLPVGDYRSKGLLTKEILCANTPERIVQCYALLHMGDAIVMRDPGYGHTRLVARDPMVMRTEDGTIDWDASYLVTHEQGVGKGSSGRNSTWQLDARYTFRQLLETNYLPITNADLQAGEVVPVQLKTEGITDPFSGSVSSNYRIISVTALLTDLQTGKTYESVEFTALDKNRHKLTVKDDGYARSTVRTAHLHDNREVLKSLPKGGYFARVSVQLSNGKHYPLWEDNCEL